MSTPVTHRIDVRSDSDYTYCGRAIADGTVWTTRPRAVTCKSCKRYPKGFGQPAKPRTVGSFHNIRVGIGATYRIGSDCYPATVIKTTAKTITIQSDAYTRVDSRGMSEMQDYRYVRDPQGDTLRVRWTTKGWSAGGFPVTFGTRRRFYDFSF